MDVVIGIFGESCTGKSTLAAELRKRTDAKVISGKDYLRLAKNGEQSEQMFHALLTEKMNSGDKLIYVISELEQMKFLPSGCLRVLVTAELSTIQTRFASRTGGKLLPPVAAMLEKKHGAFDGEPCDVHVKSGEKSIEEACDEIQQKLVAVNPG